MIKGRLGRLIVLFLFLYLLVVVFFFGTFSSSEENLTNSRNVEQPKVDVDVEPAKDVIGHEVFVRNIKKANDEIRVENLKPLMKPGILGNYELKDPIKVTGPGEYGEGVQLKGEEIKKGEESVAEYGFNEVASEKISLDRHARDTR